MSSYNKAYKDGFNQGVITVVISFIILTIIYLIVMKAQSQQDPIQAYLDKQTGHQNYFSNSEYSTTES